MLKSWGTVVTLQGIVQGYNGLLATRVMLGVCESGFFPAATYVKLLSVGPSTKMQGLYGVGVEALLLYLPLVCPRIRLTLLIVVKGIW